MEGFVALGHSRQYEGSFATILHYHFGIKIFDINTEFTYTLTSTNHDEYRSETKIL